MEFSEIASISGKSGLYKILKPGKSAVVLEAMDATKTKIVAGATNQHLHHHQRRDGAPGRRLEKD